MKTKPVAIALIALMLLAGIALAVQPTPHLKTPPGPPAFSLPPQAKAVAPGIYFLGTAFEDGRQIEGYAFIDYGPDKTEHAPASASCGPPDGLVPDVWTAFGTKCDNDGICESGEHPVKCPDCAGGGDDETDSSSCYTFLAKNAKWKTMEDFLINPANSNNLDMNVIKNNFSNDIQTWESVSTNILGAGEGTLEVLSADTVTTDGKNEVYFGSIDKDGVIAVTVVWGYFSGPPPFRELVEWDMVFDEVDFDWSLSGESGKMDFDNIATHEIGHALGMGDLYSPDTCSEVTMWGYADSGETKKRTLEAGDVTGIKALY